MRFEPVTRAVAPPLGTAPDTPAGRAVPVRPGPGPAALAFQNALLPGVSRTFALTIPQLPAGLRDTVTNGYLLCRIADTIEDEPALASADKRRFHTRFARAVAGEEDAAAFAGELGALLSRGTLAAERDLVAESERVLAVTHAFGARQRSALVRCVRTMCQGMSAFPADAGPGLASVEELHRYCYVVAGVVGELLTELFCTHSPEIAAREARLKELAVSFGQGLQLTNILKDVWDDHERGVCWLPRDLFASAGYDLARLAPDAFEPAFGDGLGELLGIAHGHLRNALEYTLCIPAGERGIRRFCLWALYMALQTLRRIDRRRDYADSAAVKIPRRSVRATVVATNLARRSDRALRLLFALWSRGLPLAPVDGYAVDHHAGEQHPVDPDPHERSSTERKGGAEWAKA